MIQSLEDRADLCHEDLRLYSVPKGVAAWATLVFLVLMTEEHRAKQGYRNYDVALINLSKIGTLILRWIRERENNAVSKVENYSWSNSLREAVGEAWETASNYSAFLGSFPMWYQDRMLAELLPGSKIRFTVPGGEVARRVSAFHKGFRPLPMPIRDEGLVLNEEQQREQDAVASQCFFSGPLRMAYPESLALYQLLLPSYLDRLSTLFRRGDNVDLGPYTVGELKRGYAALTAISSVHEHLCFIFGMRHQYPVNSSVITRTSADWAKLISKISALEEPKVAAMVKDLTMDDRFWDLHVQPFVFVDENMLAAAPQFPLHSRPDENVLRICGHVRRSYFDEASQVKEQEMLDDFLPKCPTRFSPQFRISLPSDLPDIDLLLVDEDHNAVLIAELKWLRKPIDWHERINREEDFNKGLAQLSRINSFLAVNPSYLSDKGKLPRTLDEYSQISYVLVARDHFLWPDTPDRIVVDYEVFKEIISRAASLSDLVKWLKNYAWLPVEDKDYVVRFEPAIANGVTLESEIFYRNR